MNLKAHVQRWLRPWKTNTHQPTVGPVYPASVEEAEFEYLIRPVVISGMLNTTQNAIRNAGLDTLDELLFRCSGSNMTTWASHLNKLLEFFGDNHNSLDASQIVTDTSVDVVSDADHTLTCAAGHAYKVLFASIKNSTDAAGSIGQLTYTPNGGTASVFTQIAAGGAGQAETNILLGGGGVGSKSTMHYLIGPIWMQAGDTLKIEDLNFGAADVMRKEIIYEDYTL